jgi:hypothetical protein
MSPLGMLFFMQLLKSENYRDNFILLAFACNLVILASVSVLVGIKEWKKVLFHSALPFLAVNSVISLVLIISSGALISLLYFLTLIFWFNYLKRLDSVLLDGTGGMASDSLDAIKLYAGLAAIYFFSAAFYGILAFLNFSILPLLLALGVLFFLASFVGFSVYAIPFKSAAPYALINTMAMIELAWTVSLLPFNYAVSGLILTIFYYVASGLIRNSLLDRLTKQSVKMYLGLGIACFIGIILTARWL